MTRDYHNDDHNEMDEVAYGKGYALGFNLSVTPNFYLAHLHVNPNKWFVKGLRKGYERQQELESANVALRTHLSHIAF